jgi:phospholipid-translocating ATPase
MTQLFTSLPVIFIGIFEKDLLASTLLAVPELYNIGQRSASFNIPVYLGWTFMASAEAMVVFFTMISLFAWSRTTGSNDLYAMGALTYSACVTIIAIKILYVANFAGSLITNI